MVIVIKFHQNQFNGSWDMLSWQKEEEEEEERKKERKNARETGHIRLQRMCKKRKRVGNNILRLRRQDKERSRNE